MTHRLGTRLLAVLLPATALLLPAAAHAERVVTEDSVGDVVAVQAVDGVEVMVAAADNETADITRSVVDHRAGLLKVTLSFRDLRDTFGETVLMRVRTPQRAWTVHIERRGKHTYTRLGRDFIRLNTCGGLLTTADSIDEEIVVSVPTECIGDPRWVKVGMLVIGREVEHDPETGDQGMAFVDDPHREGFTESDDPLMGEKVRRG